MAVIHDLKNMDASGRCKTYVTKSRSSAAIIKDISTDTYYVISVKNIYD